MGLATSQVRLLALTSRKADVEMQIQLNSKRKTMLTRESSELAKLYYAKLQNSKIQFATTNGYKDVNYSYLMGSDSAAFMSEIAYPGSSGMTFDMKTANEMILTDTYGRVILSDHALKACIETLNEYCGTNLDALDTVTVPELTIKAIGKLLAKKTETGSNDALSQLNALYQGLLTGENKDTNNANFTYSYGAYNNLDDTARKTLGLDVLTYLYENGVKYGGKLYKDSSENYYTTATHNSDTKVDSLEHGVFYTIQNNDKSIEGAGVNAGNDGLMYWGEGSPTGFIPWLNKSFAQQICNLLNYYGNIFSAAFNGSQFVDDTTSGANADGVAKAKHFNVAADIELYEDKGGNKQFREVSNEVYDTVNTLDNLQAGLKSGLYQLVNVSSKKTGGYSKAQGLNYFETMNYIVEKADTAERESITAWYEGAKADLSTKESYWDSEITALSAELNTINTEIDSVKSLRKDAIDSTFKWGSA